MLPGGWSLKTLDKRFLVLASFMKRIQARSKNLVKFIESEGKLPKKKYWGEGPQPGGIEAFQSLFQKGFL
jgi:hypothetical protein